jgi:FKBP-type peptidyl-prolyl cis-trans isomerase
MLHFVFFQGTIQNKVIKTKPFFHKREQFFKYKYRKNAYKSNESTVLNLSRKKYILKDRKNVNIKMELSDLSKNKNNENQDISGDGGVIKTIIQKGSGLNIQDGFQVKLNYQGQLSDGRIFDSSFTKNKPFSFIVGDGKVIKGWEVGVRSMKVGEKSKFFISSRYGYKKKGIPPIIPPNADLYFEIEIIDAVQPTVATKVPELVIKQETTGTTSKNQKNSKKNSTLDRFFFISPFSSQSGEQAPWWLNPNITFALIFFLILILFYLVYSLGGINQSFDNPRSILDSYE